MGVDRDDEVVKLKILTNPGEFEYKYQVSVSLNGFEFEMLKELSEKCGQDFDKTIRWCIAIAYGMSKR